MTNGFKKIVLSLTLSISLIGCGDGISSGSDSSAPAALKNPETLVTPTPTPHPSATPTPVPPTPTPNTSARDSVINNYKTKYQAAVPSMDFTGNIANCEAGTTSLAFQQRVIDQINYFRNLVGLGSTTLSPNQAGNQEAALMMAANASLNHSPPNTWKCYTSAGAGGAGSSNLALGADGTWAIDMYIDDWGLNNYAVGHRRWLLNSNAGTFGTGDVPGANSLAVWLGGGTSSPMPASGFVAWPSAGYFPMQNLPGSNRWSFSTSNGGFSVDTVIKVKNITDNVEYEVVKEPLYFGFGNPTIVFMPLGINRDASNRDITIQVSLYGVNVNGVTKDVSYDVILINADK